jgi:superfamily II DNA or RNA helicase
MQAKSFRPYQEEASKAVLKAWSEGQNTIVALATGGGKTLIAAGTAARVKGRVLFLANRNELCTQPVAAFFDQLGHEPAIEKADRQADLNARVVIGSVQTLSRKKRLERFPADHFDYIFADECHLSLAESWKRIFGHFKNAKRCGITATPFRSDNKSLAELFETEAYRKGIFELVDEGWLVNPDHVDRLETAISLADVRVKKTTEGLDYDVQDAADAIEPYFREIAKEIKAKYSERKILAFLPLVASSQKFVSACRAEGVNAVHVDGEDPERDLKLMQFRQGKIQLLSNSALLHTGVDIPSCDCTLNLRPTRSKVLYQQIVGRSTRTLPGVIDGLDTARSRLDAIARSEKPRAYILDPLWLSNDHDLVTPASLIAETEEEAEALRSRATGSYSLRALQREIQREREEAIRRRLEATARFREGRVQAELFAAGTHDRWLLNYQPVFGWERKPVSKFSRLLLEQRGIDPETVASEGYARALIAAVNRRRYRRMPEIRALSNAAAAQAADLWQLSARQAAQYKEVTV